MDEMIGYCGYNCHQCLARSENPAIRRELVAGWKKIYGHQEYTAENVHCGGCRCEGEVADKECRARPCAREKGLESCADCEAFPCDHLRQLIPPIFFVTEGEYNLCMRQFHGMPNLIRRLERAGQLPPRIRDYAAKMCGALTERYQR